MRCVWLQALLRVALVERAWAKLPNEESNWELGDVRQWSEPRENGLVVRHWVSWAMGHGRLVLDG